MGGGGGRGLNAHNEAYLRKYGPPTPPPYPPKGPYELRMLKASISCDAACFFSSMLYIRPYTVYRHEHSSTVNKNT